jgi:hypothetical protein
MGHIHKYLAAAAALLVATTAEPGLLKGSGAGTLLGDLPGRVATLQHDPQFILEAVAGRMGVRLRPDLAPPAILLESRTPLRRLQAAAEKHWGFQPTVFASMYAPASNEVYLIDEATLYERHQATLDDSLAHELVHYLQANYLRDRFNTDWSEVEAVAIQNWFREEFMAPRLAAAGARLATARPTSAPRRTAPGCSPARPAARSACR